MKINYKEELKSPEWQRKSCNHKYLDNYTCQICGRRDKVVHVHHHFYIEGRHIWEYPDETLITLCEDCHAKEHKFENKMIIDAIDDARKVGVMGLEIIKAIDRLVQPLKLHIQENNRVIVPSYRPFKGSNYKPTKMNSLLPIHDRKKLFLSEVEKYNAKYDVDYLQSFVDYWGKIVGKNMRFEANQDLLLSTLLEKWKDKRIEIQQEDRYKEIVAQAEEYAEERLNEYLTFYKSIIENELKVNENNIEIAKSTLKQKIQSHIENLQNTKMVEIIPKYKNIKTSVYDYLERWGYPTIYGELYRWENRRVKIFRYFSSLPENIISESCFNPHKKRKQFNDNLRKIECYFNIKLLETINLNRNVHYIMDTNTYFRRQIVKYLERYPDVLLRYKKQYSQYDITLLEPNIGKDDVAIFYTANYLLRKNAKINIERLKGLDDVELTDFCRQFGLVNGCTNKISLRTYLDSYIDKFDSLSSFTPIQIKAEAGCIRVVKSDKNCDYRVLDILNKHYNFSFVTRSINIKYDSNLSYHFSEGYDGFYGNDFIFPLDLLTETDSLDFDFCSERFNKGTMKTISLLDDSIECINYYLDKIQELIDKVGEQFD